MGMVSSSKLFIIFCCLPSLSFCSLLQASLKQYVSRWVFPRVKNCPYSFPNTVQPGTFACSKTTYHLYINQGSVKEERRSRVLVMFAADAVTHHRYKLVAFPISDSSAPVAKGAQGMGHPVWENPLCYRQGMHGGSLPQGSPASPLPRYLPLHFLLLGFFPVMTTHVMQNF